jgi:Tol biopolymer transport system component
MKLNTSAVMLLSVLVLTAFFSRAEAGQKIAFVKDNNIYIADSDGTNPRRMTSDGQSEAPALSPDGSLLAFESRRDETTGFAGITLMDVASGKTRRLDLPGVSGAEDPAFSWDGTRLAFVGMAGLRRDADDTVYADMFIGVLELADMSLTRVAVEAGAMLDMGYVYANPSFSPDGEHIVYQQSGSDVSGGFTIVDMGGNLNYSFPKNPEEDYYPYWNPRFLPEGDRVLCWSMGLSEGEADRIWIVDLRTGKKNYVTEGANASMVDDGAGMVFERWTNRMAEEAHPDLWRRDRPAQERKIVSNAYQPAGQPGPYEK